MMIFLIRGAEGSDDVRERLEVSSQVRKTYRFVERQAPGKVRTSGRWRVSPAERAVANDRVSAFTDDVVLVRLGVENDRNARLASCRLETATVAFEGREAWHLTGKVPALLEHPSSSVSRTLDG